MTRYNIDMLVFFFGLASFDGFRIQENGSSTTGGGNMNRYDGVYEGEARRAISFPLGGIGSGCVGLDGTGRLKDWEIFGRPNKGSVNGYTHFAVKAEKDGQVLDARCVHTDPFSPYSGEMDNMGHGVPRGLLAGAPHLDGCRFIGRFPAARAEFSDEDFPGDVSLSAFNPFIPLNDKDSSIPAAFFTVEIHNPTKDVIDYTVAFSLTNPAEKGGVNRMEEEKGCHAMLLTREDLDRGDPRWGEAAMATDGEDVSCQTYWYRGSWFDSLGIFWQDFARPGAIRERQYQEAGGYDTATLCVRKRCPAGGTVSVRFALSWYYPNCVNYWNPEKVDRPWKHYYATIFGGAAEAARYALRHWDRLWKGTKRFMDALYASSLPPEAMEAVGANLEVLKSPTCLRLTDGSFYAFEGCNAHTGSCEGSCTHVWNYAFALPHLFPGLERSMRELDYTYNLKEDGGMPFRLQLPLGRERWNFRACVDGQMGGIIKTYREWKIGAGDQWLKKWWPKVKRSLEYAWSPENPDRWDPEKKGVIDGRQHHTLDMELFGPNAWLNTFYLAALKAATEMARAVGENDFADECEAILAKGQAYTEKELFNGEYYFQKVDLRDKSVLEPYKNTAVLIGGDVEAAYWNEEAGQLKYQIGEGCGIDQALAQWMSDLVGLGDILDREHSQSALQSIYCYNFKPSLRKHFNPCRVYGLGREAGTVICEWPKGREKPVVPVPYSEETMHGFEYQAASHMIKRGMEKEGLEMVRAVRDRYDGTRRNPWNEIECGSNYARSMASYALLLVYSGLAYDLPKGRLGMKPLRGEEGQYFWSVEGAWGVMGFTQDRISLSVLGGELRLKEWVLPRPGDVMKVQLNGQDVGFAAGGDFVGIDVTVPEGGVLTAEMK